MKKNWFNYYWCKYAYLNGLDMVKKNKKLNIPFQLL